MTHLITKTEYSFDYTRAKEATESIIMEYPSLQQIGLTHSMTASEDEKITQCTGSILDPITNKMRFEETDFTEFNERFKNTYIYEMYKALPNIGRVRIMIMDGPKCYSIHRDITTRFHYAIETNRDCFFLFPELGTQESVPRDGNLYLVDTRYRHTFINGSKKRRIHLVFDDLTGLKSIQATTAI
jgi:hypothetical protein